MKKRSNKSPLGMEGHLIYSVDGSYYFRVYDKDFSFKDYKLLHSDLLVRIVDHDVDFYEDGDGNYYLDHSKSTLGIS